MIHDRRIGPKERSWARLELESMGKDWKAADRRWSRRGGAEAARPGLEALTDPRVVTLEDLFERVPRERKVCTGFLTREEEEAAK